MEYEFSDYMKYRWFYTASGKLVVGGKSAAQNEELLHRITKSGISAVVMHTEEPGSPFCVILAEPSSISTQDKRECAIFTGCFSRAWRAGKESARIDIFHTSQLSKEKSMKPGTWGVRPPVQHLTIPLSLVLTRQQGILRAVPPETVPKKQVLIAIAPGKIPKSDLVPKFELELEENINQEEVLSAVPAGGSRILR